MLNPISNAKKHKSMVEMVRWTNSMWQPLKLNIMIIIRGQKPEKYFTI